MTTDTPEALNAELLARIVELERELVELRARDRSGKPNLPSSDEIKRAGYAAHQALRKVADDTGAEQRATDFLRVWEALVVAAKR